MGLGSLKDSSSKSKPFSAKNRKENLRGIFDMIYSAGFNSDPDYAYLQEAFDCETMPKLFDVLEEYKTHNDFLKLKVSF